MRPLTSAHFLAVITMTYKFAHFLLNTMLTKQRLTSACPSRTFPTKYHVHPVKTQISLHICTVVSLLGSKVSSWYCILLIMHCVFHNPFAAISSNYKCACFIRAAGDTGASMIHGLTAAIIRNGKVPSDWEQSFIVCLYKGKDGALERGNYCSLKLTEQVMKVLENCGRPHQTVGVNQRFPVWLCPRQRHSRRNLCCQAAAKELSICQQETLHAVIDLEKAFDRVPRKVIWWALRKLSVKERIVQLVQGMYASARSRVHVGIVKSLKGRRCSPRLDTQPTALHHCAWSLVT